MEKLKYVGREIALTPLVANYNNVLLKLKSGKNVLYDRIITDCFCLPFFKLTCTRFIVIQPRVEVNIYRLPGRVKTTSIANFAINAEPTKEIM